MSLTEDQIAGGQTYTVTIDRTLSPKRFRDAVALVKQIGGRPEHAAKYDGATRTWTVTLPSDSVNGLRELRTLVHAYDTEVDVAGTAPVTAAPAPRPARQERPRLSAWGRASGLAEPEYSDGFTATERRAFGGE